MTDEETWAEVYRQRGEELLHHIRLAEAAEAALADLRQRLRDLRDQWQQAAIDLALEAKDLAYCKEKQAYSGGKSMGFQYAANNVAALLVDPLTPRSHEG